MNELVGILGLCGDLNRTGVEIIRYLPTLWINRAQYEEYVFPNGYAKAIPLNAGRKWLSMPVIPLGQEINTWEESHDKSVQGDLFPQRIQGIIPAHSPALALELQKMWGLKYIVEVTDMNGLKFQIGTIQTPLTFTANYSANRGGHTFSFTGRMKYKSPGSNN